VVVVVLLWVVVVVMCSGLGGLGSPLCQLLSYGNVAGSSENAIECPQKVGE